MKRDDYILILAPMVTELKLNGNNLIIFALIYGFCKDGAHKFNGSIDYICRWTNLSRPTVISTLKTLTECGYINKEEQTLNNIKTCSYTTNYEKLICGSKEILPVVKKFYAGSKDSLPNKDNNNDKDKSLSSNNKSIFVELKSKWETTNPNLPSIRCFNEKRKKAVTSLLKNNNATIDDIYKAFEIISVCSFCNGKNDRKWVATLDWILNDTKGCFNRLLEGAYAFNEDEKCKVKRILGLEFDTQTQQSDKTFFNGVEYR